ncbi:unnamed protein product [Bursaphelenchus okinawaensis]|uniref:Uncharacterized protein n=1 Tax=Bursaphelenchus okinawaensis TaxID=465554 RepID=A0A811LTG3_9BILA|nr:unnamed protein product [Bursaphelenchus okinawaensis]CAG9127702.1 unnamed protein product [Bursaphelenchus okinawaensis]
MKTEVKVNRPSSTSLLPNSVWALTKKLLESPQKEEAVPNKPSEHQTPPPYQPIAWPKYEPVLKPQYHPAFPNPTLYYQQIFPKCEPVQQNQPPYHTPQWFPPLTFVSDATGLIFAAAVYFIYGVYGYERPILLNLEAKIMEVCDDAFQALLPVRLDMLFPGRQENTISGNIPDDFGPPLSKNKSLMIGPTSQSGKPKSQMKGPDAPKSQVGKPDENKSQMKDAPKSQSGKPNPSKSRAKTRKDQAGGDQEPTVSQVEQE